MTYLELLQQNEWHQKCHEILDRDKFHCQDCGCIGFHNESGCLRLTSIEELNLFFPEWSVEGKTVSNFIGKLDTFEFERIDRFTYKHKYIYRNSIQFLEIHKIYGKDTHSYRNPRVGEFNFIMACNICPEQSSHSSVSGITIIDKVAIAHTQIKPSYTHILRFDGSIAQNPYVTIKGCNINSPYEYLNSNYEVGISYKNYFIHISVTADHVLYKGLNVHHNYYIQGKKPWDYPNSALVTLCEDCHKKRHENNSIPLLDPEHNHIKDLCKCEKCGGSGYLPQYWYRDNGVCYDCLGEGVILNDELL